MNNLEVFTPASHHNVLALVTQIAVLLFTARLFGEIAQRLKQPSVIGEILAGIILGPSCLGQIFPFLVGFVIPAKPVQGYLLEAISLIGAIFLLLVTGLETDVSLIRRHAKTALGVSFGGILVTFSLSFLLGQNLPDFLLVDPNERLVFSLFLAITMSISAIPVIAKVLIDLNLIRRDIGQTIIAAGMSDDTIGWIMLSIVAGLISGHAVSVATVLGSLLKVLAFIVMSFTLGRWLVKKIIDWVQDQGVSKDRLLALVVVLTFAWASITQSLHLEPVLGALVMGILIGRMPRIPVSVHTKLESIGLGIFAPIFFAVAGLKVNVLNLFTPALVKLSFLVIFVSIFSKVVGTYIGARLIGKRDHWTALSFGAALNARGAMGIIVATIGLSLGILNQEMFSIIVLMAMITSLMTPVALKWTLQHVKMEEEEFQRLEQEKLTKDSPISRLHRVLIPLRQWESLEEAKLIQVIKSQILNRINQKSELSITLLCVDHPSNKQKNTDFLNQMEKIFSVKEIVKKVVEGPNIVNAIIDEAQKDYDLLVLGGSKQYDNSGHIFSGPIDTLVSLSPCITMVVHASYFREDWIPKKVLVPTNGSLVARNAAEFAFLLVSSSEETVRILNVVEQDSSMWGYEALDDVFKRQLEISKQMLEGLKKIGDMQGVKALVNIEINSKPENVILDVASSEKVDLIILGTGVRSASGRLFLGPRVERILLNAPCPVVILNSPP